MNKTEFLAALRRELSFLPKDELDDAIRYYDEYINDAGDDEEKVIAEMGTPHKVAEEFKMSITTEKNVNDESAKHNNQISWKTVLVCILAVGFGVPVLNMIRNALPGITGIVILVVVIVLLIKFLGNKTNQRIAVSNTTVQTCSDIENIYLDLKAGNFEFRTGDSFAVDTMSAGEVKVKSYIANNTWTVEGSKTIGNNENGVVSIIIPKGFHAKKAVMKLTAGNILVSGLSADNTKVEVGMGKCEIKNMYSQHLNMKCGMGDIVGSCSMNGDVNVDCGMGNVTLTLTNSADNFNMSATAGMGCVDIGGTKIHGAGSKLDNNIGALHNINVKCGMGNVKIGFMPYEEVIKAEKYFESYFNGSEADEKVIERFGSPKYAAQNYYRTHVANSNANIKPPKKNGVGIWALIIILILLSPILIPLAIAVGFFAVAIIFGILCIFPFAFFSGVSMWLGGAGMILKSFFAHAEFANMVMQIGVGCIFFGLGLFMAWATVVVCIKLFPWIIRKIVALGSRLFNKKA